MYHAYRNLPRVPKTGFAISKFVLLSQNLFRITRTQKYPLTQVGYQKISTRMENHNGKWTNQLITARIKVETQNHYKECSH